MSNAVSAHARYFAREGLWEVREGKRWWTVSIGANGAAYICNENLGVIKPDGALGKNILRAVNHALGPNRALPQWRALGEERAHGISAPDQIRHPSREN